MPPKDYVMHEVNFQKEYVYRGTNIKIVLLSRQGSYIYYIREDFPKSPEWVYECDFFNYFEEYKLPTFADLDIGTEFQFNGRKYKKIYCPAIVGCLALTENTACAMDPTTQIEPC